MVVYQPLKILVAILHQQRHTHQIQPTRGGSWLRSQRRIRLRQSTASQDKLQPHTREERTSSIGSVSSMADIVFCQRVKMSDSLPDSLRKYSPQSNFSRRCCWIWSSKVCDASNQGGMTRVNGAGPTQTTPISRKLTKNASCKIYTLQYHTPRKINSVLSYKQQQVVPLLQL